MKRGDSSYNILAGQGRATQVNEAFNNGSRSTKRSQAHSELLDPMMHRNQSASGNGKTFYNKRLSSNANYKRPTAGLSRAASALDATQQRSGATSGFSYKPANLERAVRSGAHKNQILLQSHYGLSGNNSAFGFHQGTKLRGLNSSNNKQVPQTSNNDHSALKRFAIEQLSLITQSQYREEERERQNVLMSDRPGGKKGYGQAHMRSRQQWPARDDETQSADTFPQPFMLSKTTNRADTNSMYLRNVEKQRDKQLKQKDAYLQPKTNGSQQPFDQITHSAKSEGRAQKNLAHFRQLSKNAAKKTAALLDEQSKASAVEEKGGEPEKRGGQTPNLDVETSQSTAAQSSEIPKRNLLQQISLEKNKQATERKKGPLNIELPYKKNMHKQHLVRQIRDRLRKEFYAMYRSAEEAYSALDYTGTGHISREAFMNNQIVSMRIPYTAEQMRLYFIEYNLFGKGSPGLDFDTFKKNIFPHLYLVGDPADDQGDKIAEKDRNEMKKHGKGYDQIIEQRVAKLEAKLKDRFSNQFESVRKAFLALDSDFDGFITVEDILLYFGTDTDLNYYELTKLMTDKDSKKEGRINYPDFSKWLGNTIHMPQGFYFRHDSVLNPPFEQQLVTQDKTLKDHDRREAAKTLLGTDLERKILEKMQFQWKTIRKAFQDMNVSKTGKISKDEFNYFLQFWGMNITEEQFDAVFSKFDLDGDGGLSYQDFQQSIGAEMFPSEGLYFRQDKAQQSHVHPCKQSECWQPTKNTLNFCDTHQKMHEGHAVQHFSTLFKHIGPRWKEYIAALKRAADADDEAQIPHQAFIKISKQFGGKLRQEEYHQILMAFPGKVGKDQVVQVYIGRIYDQKYHQIQQRVYDRMDFTVTVDVDEPVDEIGYIGKTVHEREKLGPLKEISHGEFIQTIYKDNKLKEIMFFISQIDNHTGCVTKNELDDIIKKMYPEQLRDKNLIPIISLFSSSQNKILIDYKGFRDWILKGLAKLELKLEERRLRTKKFSRPKDSQVTALDLVAQQNSQLMQKIDNLEHRVQTLGNGKKLERSESQKPGLTREVLDSRSGRKQGEENNYTSYAQAKYRPASSYRDMSSNGGSAAPATGGKRKADLDGTQAVTKKQIDVNMHNKYTRRPHSSMASSAYNSRAKAENRLGAGLSSARGRESEYITIKDLIKKDNHYGGAKDEGKRFGSQTRNKTINTVDPRAEVAEEFQTGKTSQNNYTSYSSGNPKRRPYSSIHGANRSQIDMNKYGGGDGGKEMPGSATLGVHSMSNIHDTKKLKNGNSLQKTRSESKLLDAYGNSKLVATSDKLMHRLMNYSLEREPKDTQSQTMGNINDYDEQYEGANEGRGYDDYTDDEHGASNYQTAFEKSPDGRERNYDSPDHGERPGSAVRRLRRSESVNRPHNRGLSSGLDLLQRNASIEAGRQAQGNSNDTSQFARFKRLHRSLNLKQNMSRTKITSVSYSAKEPTVTYHAHNTPSPGDKQMLSNKLAYEWKNIYRNILQVNAEKGAREKLGSADFVTLRDLDEVCQRFRVNLTREELTRIQKLFAANSSSKHVVGDGARFSLKTVVNFVALSHILGLHRESYNYLGQHSMANQRSRSIYKLKQLYKSIEPVEEEQYTPIDAENDYNEEDRMQRQKSQFLKSGGSSQIQTLKKLKKNLGVHMNSYSDIEQDMLGRNHKTHRDRRNNLTQVTEETQKQYDKDSSTVQSQKGQSHSKNHSRPQADFLLRQSIGGQALVKGANPRSDYAINKERVMQQTRRKK